MGDFMPKTTRCRYPNRRLSRLPIRRLQDTPGRLPGRRLGRGLALVACRLQDTVGRLAASPAAAQTTAVARRLFRTLGRLAARLAAAQTTAQMHGGSMMPASCKLGRL